MLLDLFSLLTYRLHRQIIFCKSLPNQEEQPNTRIEKEKLSNRTEKLSTKAEEKRRN